VTSELTYRDGYYDSQQQWQVLIEANALYTEFSILERLELLNGRQSKRIKIEEPESKPLPPVIEIRREMKKQWGCIREAINSI
jgi:hypothetical protein